MIGYTNNAIASLTGLNSQKAPLLIIPQSAGLFMGSIAIRRLLLKFKVNYIYSGFLFFTLLSLVLISQLDHITGIAHGGRGASSQQKTAALVVFLVLNFCTGLGISVSSLISNTYFNTHYHEQKATQMISVNNSIFCFGAGLMPLAGSSLIFATEQSVNFSSVRFFFYIAIVFTAIGTIIPLFIDRNLVFWQDDSQPALSAKAESQKFVKEIKEHHHDHKASPKMHHHVFRKLLLIASLFFFCYASTETIFNFNFPAFFIIGNNVSKQITITQAFGLFFICQGIMRFLSGVILSRYISHRWFITLSIAGISTACILIMAKIAHYNLNYAYLIAAISGLGVGNI